MVWQNTRQKSLLFPTTRTYVLAGLLVAPAIYGYSQATAEPKLAATPTANLIACKSALIAGVNPAQDIRLTGTVEYIAGSQREYGTVVFLSKLDGTAKVTVTLPSGEHSSLRSPNNALTGNVTKDPGADPQPIAAHNLLSAGSWFFPEHLISILLGPTRGAMSAPDYHCAPDHICIVSQTGLNDPAGTDYMRKMSSMTVNLDQATLLPKQLDFTLYSNDNRPGQSAFIQVQYDDYRLAGGHEVPFHIRQYLNGTLHLDIMLTAVDLNASITSSDLNVR